MGGVDGQGLRFLKRYQCGEREREREREREML